MTKAITTGNQPPSKSLVEVEATPLQASAAGAHERAFPGSPR
jgi:hypothetical protein